jgi:hypothetical protein
MKIQIAGVAVALLLHADAACAQYDSLLLANELGSVLAAEDFCGLSYDQAAIQAFIESKVKADDMGFAGDLQMQTQGQAYFQNQMSISQKTAHCAQIVRVAKSYGFVK